MCSWFDWRPREAPESWESCLGLGADGRPTERAREAVAVLLHRTRSITGDVERLTALFQDSPLTYESLAHEELRESPWHGLMSYHGGDAPLSERIRRVTGLTVAEAVGRVRPLIDLFDDPTVGLPDLGAAAFGELYRDEVGMATNWGSQVSCESGYMSFDITEEVTRDFWQSWLNILGVESTRWYAARAYGELCEVVAFFTVCRRNPNVMLYFDVGGPRQGWPGWFAGMAEYFRAQFDAAPGGFDLADPDIAKLIGDEQRARATFSRLTVLARDCYEQVPRGQASYVHEDYYISRVAGRFLELCPPPRSDVVALVGEIGMLLALAPEGPALDHVPGLLGFPPGPRGPWPWRAWLDQLSGELLCRLGGLPGC